MEGRAASIYWSVHRVESPYVYANESIHIRMIFHLQLTLKLSVTLCSHFLGLFDSFPGPLIHSYLGKCLLVILGSSPSICLIVAFDLVVMALFLLAQISHGIS